MLLLELLLVIQIDVGFAFHEARSNYTQWLLSAIMHREIDENVPHFLCIHNMHLFLVLPGTGAELHCGSPHLDNVLNCAP